MHRRFHEHKIVLGVFISYHLLSYEHCFEVARKNCAKCTFTLAFDLISFNSFLWDYCCCYSFSCIWNISIYMLKMCACPICVCVYAYEWKRSICYYVVFGCWYIYMYCDYDHISSSSTNVTAYEHAYTHVRPNKLSHRQFTSCTLCCNRLSVVVCRTLWSNK